MIKKNCKRPGKDLFCHPHFWKLQYFFWLQFFDEFLHDIKHDRKIFTIWMPLVLRMNCQTQILFLQVPKTDDCWGTALIKIYIRRQYKFAAVYFCTNQNNIIVLSNSSLTDLDNSILALGILTSFFMTVCTVFSTR